jgi:general secretion pathway protein D
MQFNNQRSHILVATQRSYIYDYDISGATWDPIIRALTTGVVLEMKPTVSHDRKYITLDLRPGVATLISIEIEVIGGLVSLPIHLPLIELRFVNTTVTVPDQGTLLFSGLINDRKWDGKTGVPFFSDLPVIGRIFSANVKHRERRNLLILVNSRVVLFDEEEEKL